MPKTNTSKRSTKNIFTLLLRHYQLVFLVTLAVGWLTALAEFSLSAYYTAASPGLDGTADIITGFLIERITPIVIFGLSYVLLGKIWGSGQVRRLFGAGVITSILAILATAMSYVVTSMFTFLHDNTTFMVVLSSLLTLAIALILLFIVTASQWLRRVEVLKILFSLTVIGILSLASMSAFVVVTTQIQSIPNLSSSLWLTPFAAGFTVMTGALIVGLRIRNRSLNERLFEATLVASVITIILTAFNSILLSFLPLLLARSTESMVDYGILFTIGLIVTVGTIGVSIYGISQRDTTTRLQKKSSPKSVTKSRR